MSAATANSIAYSARTRSRSIDRARSRSIARALTKLDPPASDLEGFDKEIRFEWIGHTAAFDARTGEAEVLPSYVVPPAFAEWGVELTDWQSQCSTAVSGRALYAKDARFVPVVGCEADASTVYDKEVDLISVDSMAIEEGCYSAHYVDSKGHETVTHCVTTAPGTTEPRMRVRAKHRADGLGTVRIWREALDDEFTDGGVLASSCGGNSAVAKFAEGARDAFDVARRVDPSYDIPSDAVALPAGIWFRVVVNEDGSYDSALGYAHEESKQHLVSARARAGADESSVDVSFHRSRTA